MKKRTITMIICYIAYTSIYIARLNLSMASPALKADDILSASQIGLMGSVFSVIYACGRLFNGALSDKTAPWIMICSGLTLAGIGNIAISFFPPFWGMILLWGVNAYAQSMLWSSILCVVSVLYDEKTVGKMTSYMVTAVATGNILGIIVNTFLITKFGLNFAFVIPGGLTLVCAVLVFLCTARLKTHKVEKAEHIPMYKLFLNREVSLTVIPAMLHGVMKDNISLWMTVYFVDKFAINLNKSTYFVLFIPIVGFAGRMVYSFIYKLCGYHEHKVSIFAFVVCALSAVGICLPNISAVAAAVCLSLIYACVSLINTSLLSIFPLHFVQSGNVASVSGIMDFATYLGAGIGSFAYGFVIEKYGYTPMFVSWAVISVISIFVLLRLKHKRVLGVE